MTSGLPASALPWKGSYAFLFVAELSPHRHSVWPNLTGDFYSVKAKLFMHRLALAIVLDLILEFDILSPITQSKTQCEISTQFSGGVSPIVACPR